MGVFNDWLDLCNMGFDSDVVREIWGSAVNVPLYKSRGEMTECKNY